MQTIRLPLWETGKTPYYNAAFGQPEPTVELFLPEKENAPLPCMLVFPGGGYSVLCDSYEGAEICEALNANGFAAGLVRYRVNPYLHPVMETDARRAVRTVRYHAAEWGIDPGKIGVMGFSAGGHLTCMSALRFDAEAPVADDIDQVSARPDAAAPCYAVTLLTGDAVTPTMPEHTVGEPADPALCAALSAPTVARPDAPPFFIWHTATDQLVPVENAFALAKALIGAGVPTELHVFPQGRHGLGLAKDTPRAGEWFPLLTRWLKTVWKLS